MSDELSNPGPTKLGELENPVAGQEASEAPIANVIREFAGRVSDYLMPSITYVGEDTPLIMDLKTRLSWIVDMKEAAAKPSEIYVVNYTPQNLSMVENNVPRDAIIIVIAKIGKRIPAKAAKLLSSRISVTLYEPTVDTLLWFIKASLTLSEASYSHYGDNSRIFSVDKHHRKNLSNCFEQVTRFQHENSKHKFVISSPSDVEILAVENTLFAPMPKSIRPKVLNNVQEIKNRRPQHRFLVLRCNDEELAEFADLLEFDKSDSVHGKKLVVFHRGKTIPEYLKEKMTLIQLSSLEERRTDKMLHELMDLMSSTHIDAESQTKDKCVFPPKKDMDAVLKIYKRMSLEAITAATESAVLTALKSKAGRLESVIEAADLTEPTYYRKIAKGRALLSLSHNQ